MCYNIGMTTAEIISSVLAGLTFLGIIVALGLGISSIRQTRNLQRIQYRDKLLDDIVDWVMEISRCGHRPADFRTILEGSKNIKASKLYMSIESMNFTFILQHLVNKGKAIKLISRVFNRDLQKAIDNLLIDLESYRDINNKQTDDFINASDNAGEFHLLMDKSLNELKERKKLEISAGRVISETVKIKTSGSSLDS